jgi:hypothetical protein
VVNWKRGSIVAKLPLNIAESIDLNNPLVLLIGHQDISAGQFLAGV